MSNLPKLYGFCDAGCKWETVHRDEFLRAATCYEIGESEATTDAYHKYRIFSDKSENNFVAQIEFQSPTAAGDGYQTQATFSIGSVSYYRDYFDFEILLARYTIDKGDTAQIQIIYEVDGEQESYTQEVPNLDLTKSVLKITGANRILIHNVSAEIEVVPVMPVPTENTEKKITESGYYVAYAVYSSITYFLGVFYYPENSLGLYIRNGDYYMRIYLDGAVKVGTISRSVNESGNVVNTETELPWYTLYTAKLDS